ncbi:ABC transporter substrate-binding protein [Bartonella tamiae]|uniref:Thiamine pyrimidine synthase n=2 Tax=Bartonella tamiae TaxID=373638 RepID=J0QY83_9HYPH|nr:ABC transporter substrate-binding protein [Bartonella tamiae]EJF91056.1 hypothetical protein ME5_00388 [Bartonella tamiae Th239]EJF93279.1 hypothetical protein MEG_01493 [Bartonella tamiae Th307]
MEKQFLLILAFIFLIGLNPASPNETIKSLSTTNAFQKNKSVSRFISQKNFDRMIMSQLQNVRDYKSINVQLSSNIENEKKDTKLTLALSRNTVTPAEEIFTYAVPQYMGYFAQQNIQPKLLYTNGSTAAIQALTSGSADIAYASSLNIAAAIDKGVPIIAFAGLTVRWPYSIAVPKDSNITSIYDLKNKRIGVVSFASASYHDLRATLNHANISESDVTIVPVGAGARAAAALYNRDIDALDSYSDSFNAIQQNGLKLTFLERPQSLEKLFSVTMVTRKDVLQDKPDLLIGFVRAAYKGIIFTKLYPKLALEMGLEAFPQLKNSKPQKTTNKKILNGDGNMSFKHENEAKKSIENILQTMQIALGDSIPKDQNDPTQWGAWLNLPQERWQAVADFAYQAGLTHKKLKVGDLWDPRLMDKIYDYNAETIMRD